MIRAAAAFLGNEQQIAMSRSAAVFDADAASSQILVVAR